MKCKISTARTAVAGLVRLEIFQQVLVRSPTSSHNIQKQTINTATSENCWMFRELCINETVKDN